MRHVDILDSRDKVLLAVGVVGLSPNMGSLDMSKRFNFELFCTSRTLQPCFLANFKWAACFLFWQNRLHPGNRCIDAISVQGSSYSLCLHAGKFSIFSLIPKKCNILTKLFIWLMKVNIPLLFLFACLYLANCCLVGCVIDSKKSLCTTPWRCAQAMT